MIKTREKSFELLTQFEIKMQINIVVNLMPYSALWIIISSNAMFYNTN